LTERAEFAAPRIAREMPGRTPLRVAIGQPTAAHPDDGWPADLVLACSLASVLVKDRFTLSEAYKTRLDLQMLANIGQLLNKLFHVKY
jgi:hypothetical protein